MVCKMTARCIMAWVWGPCFRTFKAVIANRHIILFERRNKDGELALVVAKMMLHLERRRRQAKKNNDIRI